MARSFLPLLLAIAALVAVPLPVLLQPFAPGSGFLPLGNLLTSDAGGPYNLSAMPDKVAEVQGGLKPNLLTTLEPFGCQPKSTCQLPRFLADQQHALQCHLHGPWANPTAVTAKQSTTSCRCPHQHNPSASAADITSPVLIPSEEDDHDCDC